MQNVKGLQDLDAAARKDFGIDSEEKLAVLRKYAQTPAADEWQKDAQAVIDGLDQTVILTPEAFDAERQRDAKQIKLLTPAGRGPSRSFRLPQGQILRTSDAAAAMAKLAAPFADDPAAQAMVQGYLTQLIAAGRPTYRLDEDATNRDALAAREGVADQKATYPIDYVIFKGGRVTAKALNLLDAEQEAFLAARQADDPWYVFRQAAGKAGLVLLAVAILAAYVARYRPVVTQRPWNALGLALLMLLAMGLAKAAVLMGGQNPQLPYLAAGAACLGAIILTIAYGQRFAFIAGSFLSILLSLELGMPMGFFLVLITGVTLSVLPMKEIRTRSKLIEVGAFAAAGVFAAVLVTQLAGGEPIKLSILASTGWAAFSVLAAGFLMQGILPVIERTFRVATSMTLLEWCDANKPLLKRLAHGGPRHVQPLAAAGHDVRGGGRGHRRPRPAGPRGGLLPRHRQDQQARVLRGEPARQPASQHAKLSPAMSLLIIIGHVKDGLEMAREYGLPPVLHEFIASHHGTTLVQYFYHAAAEQRKADGRPRARGGGVPLPRPQAAQPKEAAILMLADAAESAVRAMPEPTPGRIETQVHVMIIRAADGRPARRVRPDPPRGARDRGFLGQEPLRHLPRPNRLPQQQTQRPTRTPGRTGLTGYHFRFSICDFRLQRRGRNSPRAGATAKRLAATA